MVLVVVIMVWTAVEVGVMVLEWMDELHHAVGPSCSCHKWIVAGAVMRRRLTFFSTDPSMQYRISNDPSG